ncbi:hypothetical protein DSCW_50920 [Desulfosarcina widdelii]|uniref:Laminin G domain-containing protein n=1 Tax=Desulfosarcina widdelii TaxID=947919 RepID=A0A5K7ZAC0_9BACT|nr:LamG domain-containing protein [Desulfosarcina widdelii]BBO77675.1 hypothetical protein DSCW_50920 [Desulfosarcina widdelii]
MRKFVFGLAVMVFAGWFLVVADATFAACPDNITGYWKLNESAAPYADFIGGRDGAVATGKLAPADAAGVVGNAKLFDNAGGSETGIDVPASSSFNWAVEDSFSIEVWVRTDGDIAAPAANQVFVGRYDSTENLQWWIGINTSGNAAFYLQDGSGDTTTVTNAAGVDLTDGTWHHVVAVRDGSNNLLYVDGTLEDSDNTPAFTKGFDSGSAEMNIGWLNRTPFYHFAGLLDEVAVYDRALPQSEIEDHYDAGFLQGDDYCAGSDAPSDAPYPEDTISLWKLDEAGGSTYVDSFGGHDGDGNPDPTPATGTVDGAQDFNTDKGIDVPAYSAINWANTDDFSIEVWVSTVGDIAVPGDNQVFIGRWDSNQGTGMQLWVGMDTSGQAVFQLKDGTGAALDIRGSDDLTDGTWHHVVAVRDGNNNLLYVDGALQDSDNTPAFTRGFGSGASELNIGWLDQGDYYFDGLLDEVAVYGRALPQSEIEDHYDAGLQGDGIETANPINDDDDDDSSSGGGGGGGGGGCFISSMF